MKAKSIRAWRNGAAVFIAAAAAELLHAEDPMTATPKATLIVINAKVWTGVEGAAEAEALAVEGDRIVALGSAEDVRKRAGEKTITIDAGGRRVIPGITDSHTHFIWTGLHLTRLDLRTARSKEEFRNMVAAGAARMRPGQWLEGGQFTVESWEKPESPRKDWIDDLTPATPVFLSRMDGHMALANSVALKIAKIDAKGPADPPGGEIERDATTGEPTGILKDDAMSLVSDHIPAPSAEEKRAALALAQKMAHAWGITAVHDMSDPADLPVFLAADERHELAVRVVSYVQTTEFEKMLPRVAGLVGRKGMFRLAGFKAFMDGSLGSRTAYMREPFENMPAHAKHPRGLRTGHASDLDAFGRQIQWAAEHGMQMAVHAIGDEANHELLDIYAGVPDIAAKRFRIEHAQHLLPEDIARFAKLGVIASMQPLHKADDGRWAEAVLGAERSKTTYAFRSLIAAGAVVSFGSDCPVVTANPYLGMAAAVSALTLDGKTWVPEQSTTLEQALRAYTAIPPYAVFEEKERGALAEGMLADFAILDHDILDMPVERLGKTEAWVTVVAGQIVYRAPR